MTQLKWERNPLLAKMLEKPSVACHPLIYRSRCVLEVNHMNVINEGMPLFKVLPIDNTVILRLERKHLNVMYVGKPSVKVLTLDDMR